MRKITFLFAAAIAFAFCENADAQNIVINEILTSNTSINTDEDGDYQDWVELYNNGPASVNLNGYGLTDDSTLPFKWTFPNVSVPSGQYLLVYCSDKNRAVAGSPLHTNFKISSSGEAITLTKPGGVIQNQVPAIAIQQNISYGRSPNGTGSFVFFQVVTPNAVNNATGYSGVLNPPVFSQAGGFFTSAFNLTLSSPDPGTTILYTLDGSEPDENNLSGTTYTYKNQYTELPGQPTGPLLTKSYQTLQYTAPINIINRTSQPNKISAISSTYSFDPSYYIPDTNVFKGTVVRVKVIKPGAMPSPVVSQSYFISPQGSGRFSLPVISLSFSENKFFDYNEGIYVAGVDYDTWRAAFPSLLPRGREVGNYYRRGIENERVANMSYFVNGTEVLNQDVGLRIRGASTRRYESKALTVYARSDYGDDKLSYKFFPDLDDNSFARLTLSNSGSDFRNTMFRDALAQEISKHLHVENENYRPAITFFNGEYWGILNIRERFDNEYFKRVYDISDVDLLENQGEDAEEGDVVHYQAMINFVEGNSLAVPANYEYVKTQMDPESFTDYYITNIYLDNSDWPGNNTMFWRKRTASYEPGAPYGHDGRWRWIFHDMDDTFSFGTDDFAHDNLYVASMPSESWPNPEWSTLMLRKLLENNSYKNDFINRFADLMNTTFLPSRIISIMDTMSGVIAASIPEHITRWSLPSSVDSWEYYLDYQKDFATERPFYQREHIKSRFNIASAINATLNVSHPTHGHIKINTIDIASGTPGISANPYPWTGVYFSNIPVKLKAIAKEGFVFSHWTGASNSTNPEIVIDSAVSFSVTAVFASAEPVQISEPVYFWMMNNAIPNDTPLLTLNSSYELLSDAVIQFQSSFAGYPFTSAHPNWRKGSMERRNAPTAVNYRPEANNNAPYVAGNMRGLQITQPFQNGSLENTMVFNLSTVGFKDIKFSLAVKDEGAATGITMDYSINAGTPAWITTGMATSTFPLTNAFELIQSDFSAIASVVNNPNFKIRLRFTGPNMTADTGARVTFNNIALDGIRIPLIYPTPHIFTAGTSIASISPTVSGGTVLSFSISPALPAGLVFNTTTGVISGTPTATAATAIYTVTANYSGGSATANVVITVNAAAPGNLSYPSPNTLTVGVAASGLNPTVTGTVASYTVAPALPAGLTLNPATGVISGTPTTVSSATTYTVTAANAGGSTTFGIVISVNDAAPMALTYSSPNIFTVGSAISNLSPSVNGGTVTGYSVSPALPSGLTLNPSTGIISGTPASVAGTATYTVTATNSGGSANFGVVITVNNVSPASLTYLSPNTFTKNLAISPLSPTVSGGAVTSFSVMPALPSGLTLNPSTGVITGTPTAVTATAAYTVTAANSGGTTTFNVIITVNDTAPTALNYPSPNVFTSGVAISPLIPTFSGAVTAFGISPALPAGLMFNPNTGVISGTPVAVAAAATYTVTATNSGGDVSFGVVITVNDAAPAALSYTTPNIYTAGSAITPLTPSVSGGAVISYSVSPALPAGLSINPTSGVISGTPTLVVAAASYIVTAANSGGSTTFGISITVNDVAPEALSYATPNIFVVGSTISPLVPSISGNVISYSVSPSLPGGLTLNPTTGVISGTPLTVSGTAVYIVTATNSGGNAAFAVTITVNDVAPEGLSYPSPNIYTAGTAIMPLTPTITGSGYTFSVSPALPSGLILNPSTGVISGTPTTVQSTAAYTVTATNTGGSATFEVVITVNDIAPVFLSYSSPNTFTSGSAITPLAPSVSGGTVTSYSITPSLPAGLAFNTATGVISGTPTAPTASTGYTIVAHNSGGEASFTVVITVNAIAPSGLSYNTPNVYTIGSAIISLTPAVSGGSVTNYSVTPALPSGLSLNSATGVISGTPVTVSASAGYTVTASNSGGNTSFTVNITVNDVAPAGLSYPSPNIYTVGSPIISLHPSVSGNVISYSVSPALPSGLLLNAATGFISGTPSQVTPVGTYTITATNSGGSISFGVQITVKDIAPSALSYNSPNVFTTGVPITSLQPSVTGNVTGYTVTPALPAGLQLHPVTGIISGTPTAVTANAGYTVTASNSGGTVSFNIIITVNDAAPAALSYNSPNIFMVGSAIAALSPSVTGTVTGYSVAPSLPSGLSLNATTGVISGTPTAVSATATYTVTASNSGGSTSFGIAITIKDIAPAGLSYTSPVTFIVGMPIVSLTPTVTGNVSSYSIIPSLPAGLTFNTATGQISGTPSAVTAMATYTVTATNSGGTASFGVVITVSETAPTALSYSSPHVFTIGSEIIALNPSVTGNVSTYSVSPALPAGLSLNPVTGIISGTPTSVTAVAVYTVTASNSGGSTTFGISITVNDAAPHSLSYHTPNVYTINVPIVPLTPTVTGNVTGFSIFPSLPAGLVFNTATGVISGTPVAFVQISNHTVTAFNSGGDVSFAVAITIADVAPSGLSYTTPNVFTSGIAITPLVPTITGNTTGYTISPALPTGLSINLTTGVISGVPFSITPTESYLVTATNSGGNATFSVQITVNAAAPTALTYNSPNTFTIGTAITPLTPTVTGNVAHYSISPSLPDGLQINNATGIISGTPTEISTTSTYTVTATNSGGSTSFQVVITVNAVSPGALTYNSPNVFTVGSAIVALSPSISGTVTGYSVSPALPAGLTLNPTTGVISGTPTMVSPISTYTVTAANSGGSTSFGIVITVNAVAPNGLSYNSPNVFTVGSTIAALSPSISGSVTGYSVSPSLPAGLTLNPTTGVISGTPTGVFPTATYTVTATNSGGSTSFGVVITVNAVAPNGLSYNSPNVFSVGSTIVPLAPSISGSVTGYSISPTLPAGLTFGSTTGVISGTPTVASATSTYTVTATNSGGSTSFGVVITVNAVAPSGLSYNSPNVFIVGSPIVTLSPSISGSVTGYSVSPSLPAGLTLNPTTGMISGTPTVASATSTYTVTATNSGGSTSFGIVITVNAVAPNGLSYNSPNVFTVGSPIVTLSPSVSGSVTGYSVSPSLPAGLTLNPTTGMISGTPTAVSATSTYTVTATNSGGSTSFGIVITVNAVAPNGLSYNSPNVFTVGSAIVALSPSVSGSVTGYSVSPALPAGLTLNPTTGMISGTPTGVSATSTYTVTATNSGGSTSFGIVITVTDGAPNGLSYNSPNVFTVGSAIVALSPSVSGTVTAFSVSPSLPAGLTLNPTTGMISGTPTMVSPISTYTVTATNSGGSTSFGIVITVNDGAPLALSYNSSNVFTVNSTITPLNPTVIGTGITFTVAPALPAGLSLDPVTGIISGTPDVISATTSYTITATNSGGSISFSIFITVNDVAPAGLTYSSPNVFTLGTAITPLLPTVTGNVVTYSISPQLPAGLTFNSATGIISGTPTAVSATSAYTVTATNSGGNASFEVVITVKDTMPSGLSYTSPNIFTVNMPIAGLIPTVTGNITGFTVFPALPDGLSLDPVTGIISGTPTAVTAIAAYTVTAFNTGGSTSFDVVITVDEELATPESIFGAVNVYPNPFMYSINIGGFDEEVDYILYSVEGKRVQSGKVTTKIEFGELAAGVYMLHLTHEGQTKIVKIIRENN
ncbi:MAG TPA: putative Ig domain-containing protein [Flavobacterium sp.]